jgi:hypothetical protein
VELVVAGAVEGDEIGETFAADAVVAAVVQMAAFERPGGTTDLAGWIAAIPADPPPVASVRG